MNILVFGGKRFMGVHLVKALLRDQHQVTIASRGTTKDTFGNQVQRIKVDRNDRQEIENKLGNHHYDIVYDTIAYCSNNIKDLLDVLSCNKYICVSTMSVYDLHLNVVEEDFDPHTKEIIWCNREDIEYGEGKRLVESAIFQQYPQVEAIALRFSFVIGEDDYTKRLFFYVEHIMKQKPMFIDNLDAQMSFIRSDEAGKCMARLANSKYIGVVNCASEGTISLQEIIEYVSSKVHIQPILEDTGEVAPYNTVPSYSINTNRAIQLGCLFTPLNQWIYDLLDVYITDINNS